MRIEPDQTVLLTGASGGLGTHMVRAFAQRRTRLALVAYPGNELDGMRRELEANGCAVAVWALDLSDASQRHQLFREVTEQLGAVDILVNNAGIEFTAAYHDLTEQNILDVIKVNLEAPMILTRLVLPQMLSRKRGHIVNISSLAGKSGPAFQEPYAATKAGLVAFTSSLRATYRGTGVSASVITPGFVEAGIYAKLRERSGLSAPALLGTTRPEKVGAAVIRAIEKDSLEIIVNALPVRPLFAFNALFPTLGERVTNLFGANDYFRAVASRLRDGRS